MGRSSTPPSDEDEFISPTAAEIAYLRRQQDPYAKLSVTLREPQASESKTHQEQTTSNNETISRKDFEFEARRILGFYVPRVSVALPKHYREFIARNAKRDGKARFKVLHQLRRYDVSTISGIETHFNREKEEITEKKLREIERAAGIKD